jgi:hypothetical protein
MSRDRHRDERGEREPFSRGRGLDEGSDDGMIASRGFGNRSAGFDRGRELGGERDRDERRRPAGDDDYSGDFYGASRGAGRDDRRPYAGEPAGPHRGRGPRGYQRSDERIREDVSDRLTEDPHIDASDVEVAVQGGEVTLSGHVDSRSAKRHAEDIAESVSGVAHVQNNLRVRQASGTAGPIGAAAPMATGAIEGTAPAGGPVGGAAGTGPGGVEVTRTPSGRRRSGST